MKTPTATSTDKDPTRITVHPVLDDEAKRNLAFDALDGLTHPVKIIQIKHNYDERGSQLFDEICAQPEYYPSRTEKKILETYAQEIINCTEATELVELGAGFATKTRVLLNAMDAVGKLKRYIPLDVAESTVRTCAEALAQEYPRLTVYGVVGDFEHHLNYLPLGNSRIVALLGNTIGNFPPGSRRQMLKRIAAILGPNDYFLLGTDLVKDPAILEAAYNDAAGAMAAFNRNTLHVLNRELGANFNPDNFAHIAFFDRQYEWIDIRLRAHHSCSVNLPGIDLQIEFAKGEELCTLVSAKFTRQRVEQDYGVAGLELVEWFEDQDHLFAVSLARRVRH